VNVGCVLLAAGAGKRFGGDGEKLFYEVGGTPMIVTALSLFAKLSFSAKVCVVRAGEERISALAKTVGFTPAENPNADQGVGTSVSVGTYAAFAGRPDLDGVLYAVSDQPFLSKASLLRLLEAFEQSSNRIVSLSFQGTRGNPAIFPRALYGELLALDADTGGGAVIKSHPELLTLVEADSARELMDIDCARTGGIKKKNWETLETCARSSGRTESEIATLFCGANENDPAMLEECLDILVDALTESGLDANSEPTAWGLVIEDAISLFSRLLQRANDN
jgi:molybdenum cofactor cytidylyltransferase